MPNYCESVLNLSTIQGYSNALEDEVISLKLIRHLDPDNYGLRAGVNLAICKFLETSFKNSKEYLLDSQQIQKKVAIGFRNESIPPIFT